MRSKIHAVHNAEFVIFLQNTWIKCIKPRKISIYSQWGEIF